MGHTDVGMISKLISLPTMLSNITGGLTRIPIMPDEKKNLYNQILQNISSLSLADQILIINKLLTLK